MIRRFLLAQKGSVLMEFVLVLPVYMVALGGILWIGMRSLDATGLRSADRWGAWEAGGRFEMRIPAIGALQSIFPRTSLIFTNSQRVLPTEESYLQFIGAGAKIESSMPDFIESWLGMPETIYGEETSSQSIFDKVMSSSRYGNKYTQYIIMRTKHSAKARRHWHPSLIYEHDIWKFEGEDYPKKWDNELLSKAKYTNDDKEGKKEPEKIDFYTRLELFEKWSKKN